MTTAPAVADEIGDEMFWRGRDAVLLKRFDKGDTGCPMPSSIRRLPS